jgi:hypothetical protein
MPVSRDVLRQDKAKTPRLWEDLLTGLSLGVFLLLMACVLAGAWLYESGV